MILYFYLVQYIHVTSFSFSDIPSSLSFGGLHSSAGVKRFPGVMSALNSMETMQKSVMNAFALKYSESTSLETSFYPLKLDIPCLL